ncbi:hypothetical protein CRG98_022106 [Punica granatum]|uniref:Uncharacterized protein n=1 Tax=Punica granatum TaxID=22663 RepID=A0A2I0JMF3_PUNGR|nr:hypothetical protein CRG98_022106 [Punica granatum]
MPRFVPPRSYILLDCAHPQVHQDYFLGLLGAPHAGAPKSYTSGRSGCASSSMVRVFVSFRLDRGYFRSSKCLVFYGLPPSLSLSLSLSASVSLFVPSGSPASYRLGSVRQPLLACLLCGADSHSPEKRDLFPSESTQSASPVNREFLGDSELRYFCAGRNFSDYRGEKQICEGCADSVALHFGFLLLFRLASVIGGASTERERELDKKIVQKLRRR